MAKKKQKSKVIPFRQESRIAYNAKKPNRQARRLGIKPIEQEEPKRVSKAQALTERVQQAKEAERKIVPPGMTYGQYMEYLKEKRQQLEENMKKEYVFEELGYFLERECKAIKECMQGKTYMNFDIKWSNVAGNCTLIAATDYEAEEAEIKNFFLNCALGMIFQIKRTT